MRQLCTTTNAAILNYFLHCIPSLDIDCISLACYFATNHAYFPQQCRIILSSYGLSEAFVQQHFCHCVHELHNNFNQFLTLKWPKLEVAYVSQNGLMLQPTLKSLSFDFAFWSKLGNSDLLETMNKLPLLEKLQWRNTLTCTLEQYQQVIAHEKMHTITKLAAMSGIVPLLHCFENLNELRIDDKMKAADMEHWPTLLNIQSLIVKDIENEGIALLPLSLRHLKITQAFKDFPNVKHLCNLTDLDVSIKRPARPQDMQQFLPKLQRLSITCPIDTAESVISLFAYVKSVQLKLLEKETQHTH